ncbi:hypothetical protein ACQWHL_26845, partial [Salmonella enterica subsp. enterica serovar Infantis]
MEFSLGLARLSRYIFSTRAVSEHLVAAGAGGDLAGEGRCHLALFSPVASPVAIRGGPQGVALRKVIV